MGFHEYSYYWVLTQCCLERSRPRSDCGPSFPGGLAKVAACTDQICHVVLSVPREACRPASNVIFPTRRVTKGSCSLSVTGCDLCVIFRWVDDTDAHVSFKPLLARDCHLAQCQAYSSVQCSYCVLHVHVHAGIHVCVYVEISGQGLSQSFRLKLLARPHLVGILWRNWLSLTQLVSVAKNFVVRSEGRKYTSPSFCQNLV